jgi:hypothetical protein
LIRKRYLGKTMLLRIAALLPLCSHVRVFGFGGSPERIFVFPTPGKSFQNFPRKGSKNFTQYFSERPEMTTQ